MTLLYKKEFGKWHLFGLCAVFLALTVMVFYQLFVNKNYQTIRPTIFFKEKNLENAIKRLFIHKNQADVSQIFFIQNGAVYKNLATPSLAFKIEEEAKENQYFLSPGRNKLAFLNNNNQLVIEDLTANKQAQKENLSTEGDFHIIHWSKNNEDIFLSQKKDNWSIVKFSENKLETIKKDIIFNQKWLTRVFSFVGEKIVYPDCREICEFAILDLETGATEKIPALIEHNPDARIKDLIFEFYDETERLIAYQRVPQAEPQNFFVINFDKELVQVIKLVLNNKRQADFVGYFPQTQEMLFASQGLEADFQDLFLYKANKPSLKIIAKIDHNHFVKPINNKFYVVGGLYLRNIDDPEFNKEINDKKIIEVY